jgi:hypothetical protein
MVIVGNKLIIRHVAIGRFNYKPLTKIYFILDSVLDIILMYVCVYTCHFLRFLQGKETQVAF